MSLLVTSAFARAALWLLAGSALLISACGRATEIQDNQRLSGQSYFMISRLDLVPDQCRSLCKEDGNDCAGWSWVAPTEEEPLAECTLFVQVDQVLSDPCCVSGKFPVSHNPQSQAFGKTRRLPKQPK